MLRRLAVLSLALAAPVLASAQSADVRGPVPRVTLIELFTSEGGHTAWSPGGAVAPDEDDGTAAPRATRSVVNEP